MWKKENEFPQRPEPVTTPAPRIAPAEPRREIATIGPSITVKGDISGGEDLIILGRVEGKVDLKENNVTVGKSGRLKADIQAKLINVEGEIEGNLLGVEKVLIRQSGNVRGNILAPRVSLEDGSRFKGSIDMSSRAEEEPDAEAKTRAGSAQAKEFTVNLASAEDDPARSSR